MKKTTRNIIIIVTAAVLAIGVVLAIVLPLTLRHRNEKFTVTFDSNGGSAVASVSDVPYGSLIDEPEQPFRDGHEFGGWFKNSDLAEQWIFETDKVVADVTLYAKWNYTPTVDIGATLNSENNSYTITGLGSAQNVENLLIPDAINGIPVTTVAQNAFKQNKTLKTVFIPSSVTVVRNSAFEGCESLTSVTFDGESTVLGKRIFYNCAKLENVKLPVGLTYLDEGSFYDCTSLVNVELPQTLTKVGKDAFSGCKALGGIEFPATLTSLEDKAFGRCSSLKTVRLPKALNFLGENVFAGCTGLESLSVESGGKFYSSDNNRESNCIIEITTQNGETVNVLRVGCKTSQIPSNPNRPIKQIGDGAFCGSVITGMVIPEGVEIIGEQAFSGCELLKQITIPGSVTEIGYLAFSSCYSLEEVKFAQMNEQDETAKHYSIKKIGIKAFEWCQNLDGFELPGTLEFIGAGIFYMNSGMTITTGLTINDLRQVIGEADEDGKVYTEQMYVKCYDGQTYLVSGLA